MTGNNPGLSGAARAGGSILHRVRQAVDPSASRSAAGGDPASGWLAVTVWGDVPAGLDTEHRPAPLAELGDRIEVRVQPAPGGKGTELAARLRNRPSGSAPERLRGKDPEAGLRSALREAKQLLEVGEVLVVDPAPHGERTPTPGGALLEAWTKVAPKAGVR